jgi:acetylornithine deacetylase/succinyl-diaminopimelate desuccinylase-like protein
MTPFLPAETASLAGKIKNWEPQGESETRIVGKTRSPRRRVACTGFDEVTPARTDAAKSLGLATMDLPSGAVQDAQQMAKLAPFGMIFVPSRDGISDSPKEFTS